MLFCYKYPDNHDLEKLNKYLVSFLSSIGETSANSKLILDKYCDAEFAEIIKRSPKLKEKLSKFFSSYKILSAEKKAKFFDLVLKSQKPDAIFQDCSIDVSDTKTDKIIEIVGDTSFNNLVNHLFKNNLKSLNIKDHYILIYDALEYKTCAFCGVETMHKSFQEDYDHLAAKKHYPILAIHPMNLAPMCHTCNSKNKGEKDILNNTDGSRKSFIYPYSQSYEVELDFSTCIIPQTNIDTPDGSWNIKFIPNDLITDNWNFIFNVSKRYREDYLEPNFEYWLDEFIDGLIYAKINIVTQEDIIAQLAEWSNNLQKKKFLNTNFLKAPLFKYLSNFNVDFFYKTLFDRFKYKEAI
jgi:hypothetical protein